MENEKENVSFWKQHKEVASAAADIVSFSKMADPSTAKRQILMKRSVLALLERFSAVEKRQAVAEATEKFCAREMQKVYTPGRKEKYIALSKAIKSLAAMGNDPRVDDCLRDLKAKLEEEVAALSSQLETKAEIIYTTSSSWRS